ncbi:MAG TPA: transglutaminase family protein [Casimicrobiaceae bacterium]|nr:transglutaminase family protein [Casimicrobiaceae bacterium]
MQRYRIRHETRCSYASDVVHAHHLLHLVPRPLPFQQGVSFVLELTPAADGREDVVDVFGNVVTRLEFARAHRRLDVVSALQVDVHARPPAFAELTDAWEVVRDGLSYGGSWPARERLEACRFRHASPYVRVKRIYTDYAEECFPARRPILACADALMVKLHREFEYAPGETTIETPLHEVLRDRSGVCQDFAHVMIACLRSRGLAARYVSGYLRTRPRTRAAASGGALVGTGASHAWVSVYSPPLGWVDLDPTNNCRVGLDHIALAWGRDFGDVSPLRGVILGGHGHQLQVTVTVEALTQ